jgi:hypothetical protein
MRDPPRPKKVNGSDKNGHSRPKYHAFPSKDMPEERQWNLEFLNNISCVSVA